MNKFIEGRNFFMRLKTEDGKFYNYVELPMSELDKHLKRKSKDIGFWLNQLKDGKNSHKIENFDVPYFSWIDIDFHNNQSKKDFLKDIKRKFKNVDEFFESLSKDKHFYIIGRSQGGGIRIVATYDLIYDLDSETDESLYMEFMSTKQKEIYKIITNKLIDYITKYSLRNNATYMDACSTKISQPTFGLRDDKYFYINKNHKSFEHKFDLNELETIAQPKQELSDIELLDRCVDNSTLTRELYDSNADLSKIFTTHNPALISIVRFCDEDAIKKWYEMYVKFYTGNSFKRFLSDFDTFNNYLDISKSLTKPGSLYWFLKNS